MSGDMLSWEGHPILVVMRSRCNKEGLDEDNVLSSNMTCWNIRSGSQWPAPQLYPR